MNSKNLFRVLMVAILSTVMSFGLVSCSDDDETPAESTNKYEGTYTFNSVKKPDGTALPIPEDQKPAIEKSLPFTKFNLDDGKFMLKGMPPSHNFLYSVEEGKVLVNMSMGGGKKTMTRGGMNAMQVLGLLLSNNTLTLYETKVDDVLGLEYEIDLVKVLTALSESQRVITNGDILRILGDIDIVEDEAFLAFKDELSKKPKNEAFDPNVEYVQNVLLKNEAFKEALTNLENLNSSVVAAYDQFIEGLALLNIKEGDMSRIVFKWGALEPLQ